MHQNHLPPADWGVPRNECLLTRFSAASDAVVFKSHLETLLWAWDPSAACTALSLYLSLDCTLLEEQNFNISLVSPNIKLRTEYVANAQTCNLETLNDN